MDRRVSGFDFGRWLCKTHCNLTTINGGTPDIVYVQYAFGRPLRKPIHFFLVATPGDELLIGGALVSWRIGPAFDGCAISVAGLQTIVSPDPTLQNSRKLHDRIKVFQQPTPLGMFRIVFDWSGEPSVA